MKTIFLTLLIGTYSSVSFSQATELATFSHSRYNNHLNNYLTDYLLSNDSITHRITAICDQSTFFIKFVISKEGSVKSISFSKKTHPLLKQKYTQALTSTSSFWKASRVNGKPVDSYVFLLPVSYNYSSGCVTEKEYTFEKKDTTNTLTPPQLDENGWPMEKPSKSAKTHLVHSINMLDFEDNSDLSKQPCIILPGVHSESFD